MVEIEYIRKKHLVDGWSIRKISRQLHIARQTVRKALKGAELPRYHRTKPRPCPVLDSYRAVIQTWLDDDVHAPPKQRHTAKRIYDRLVAEYGFPGSESAVRRQVARLRGKMPEVYIPLTAAWGQQAQIDWGQATVEIGGVAVVAHLFCLKLRASSVPFAWAAPTEKLEAFLEGHIRAFAWLGGVPAECLYDNPKTAVVRILAGPKREEHQTFSQLRAHYLFESLFCRPAEAHEKGAVENLVGYVRRNTLVPVPAVASWEELNAHLLTWCERERTAAGERWEQERQQLRPLPDQPFIAGVRSLAVVSRLSLIRVDHNRYSVPCQYVGQAVQVLRSTFAIDVGVKDEPIAHHARCYRRGETLLQLEHYLPAIARKPHAVSHAAVIAQLPPIYAQVRDRLCRAMPDGYRQFAAILLLHQEFPAEAVRTALEQAAEHDCLQVDTVRQLILNDLAPRPPAPLALPQRLAECRVPAPDVGQYNALLAEGSI